MAKLEIADRIWVTVLVASAAFPIRFPVLGHSASVFDVVLLALIVPWLLTLRRVGLPRVPRPYLWLGGGMIAAGALSLAWTSDRSETLLFTVACVEGVLALCMVLTFLRNVGLPDLVRILQLWALLLIIPGALLWMHVPGFQPPATLDPSTGDYISYFVRFSNPWIGRSNNLAALLLLLMPPLVAWALRTRKPLDIGLAALAELAFSLAISRGAILALMGGVALYFVLEKRRRRMVFTAVLWYVPVAVLAVVVGWLNPPTRMYVASRFQGSNVDARIDLLQQALDADDGSGTPGGSGGGGGFTVPRWILGRGGGVGTDVHNTYVQQVVSFGVVMGAALAVALVVTGIWWFRRNRLQLPSTARVHGIGVAAILVSFLFESSFEGSLLRPLIWMGWGLLVVGALRPAVRTIPWAAVRPRWRTKGVTTADR